MTSIEDALDLELVGVWRGAFDEDAGRHHFHFLEQDDGSITGLWVALPHDDKKGGWLKFSLRTAVRRGHAVANIRWRVFNGNTAEGNAASAVFRVFYRIHGRQLSIYLENQEATAAAPSVGGVEAVRETQHSHPGATERASAPVRSASPDRAALGPPLVVLTRVE